MLNNSKLILLITALFVALISQDATARTSWTYRARRVGMGETVAAREAALSSLRKEKNLSAKITAALDSKNRALALDVITALPLKNLVPELQSRAASDPDGFLILALSALLDEQNKDSILKTYTDALSNEAELSPAAIVSMLEPLGRLGQALPKDVVERLAAHSFPEVRSSLLAYLRTLALTHNKRDHDAVISKFLTASEFQLRLQAISLLKEVASQTGKTPIVEVAELEKHCQKERPTRIKDQCLSFLRRGQK